MATLGRDVVCAVFENRKVADQQLAAIRAAGYTNVEVSSTEDPADIEPVAADVHTQDMSTAAGFFSEHDSRASTFIDELQKLGFSGHDAHDLVDAVVSGKALVTADAQGDVDKLTTLIARDALDVRSARVGNDGAPASATSTTQTADASLQLRAERLAVNKHVVQHGEVRVRKELVTETQHIDVPVSREELVVERIASPDHPAADAISGVDEVVRIPLSQERVSVSKRAVVTEDVEVGTRRVESTVHVDETLRHEELAVDDLSHSTANTLLKDENIK